MSAGDLNNGEACEVFIFDFDGVLAKAAEGEAPAPRLLGISLLRTATARGIVYIYTGRHCRERDLILSLLREWGIRPSRINGILCRSSGVSEVDAKLGHLARVLEVEGCIGEVHDDNPYILSSIRRHTRFHALVLHYDDSCEVIQGRSLLGGCRESR